MRIILTAFAIFLNASAFAQGEASPRLEPLASVASESQTVTIEGIKAPLSIKLSRLIRGVEAFESGRKHAPEATLRFTFIGIKPNATSLKVWLESGDLRMRVELNSRGEFSVPTVSPDVIAGATLVANREVGSGKIRPLVRTAGLADEARRLGDLRLECSVLWEIEKDDVPLLFRAAFGVVGGACNSSKVSFSFPAARRLLSAEVVDGAQRADVQVIQGGQGYRPPLHDASLRDDAIVKFTFTDA